MSTIQIIGLGAGREDELTLKALNALNEGIPTFARTNRHPVIKKFSQQKAINTFDEYFEKYQTFEEVYSEIVKSLIELSKKHEKINYCVAGSPLYGDIVTKTLLNEYKDEIKVIIIDGMSFLDKCIKLSGFSNYKSVLVLDCLEVDEYSFDIISANIITQVYDLDLASHLKIKLMESYPEDFIILRVDVIEETVQKIPLFKLDQDKNYGFSTYFCVLPIDISKNVLYNMDNLFRIVKILRGPDGCPWDRAQTHQSIRQNMIEEAYEAVDAIDNDDVDNLVEELGDLLLQVVLHSEIASEEGYFNISDVVTHICKKMYSRHPHVFGETKANSAEEALISWEKSKQKEKNLNTYTENLRNVPKALSPLSRSYKIQKRAADVGFDWPDAEGAIKKIKEELFEFIDEYNKYNLDKMEEEFGDLLFSLVNLSRFLKINPDIALNKTINKFINRFEFIENNAKKDLKSMTLQEMDELWEKSKFQ